MRIGQDNLLRTPAKSETLAVAVNSRAVKSLRSGHPWIYQSDLSAKNAGSPPRGALVHVTDERGMFLASALSSSTSQIALRVISPEAIADSALPALLAERFRAAVAYRKSVVHNSDAYRVVFSEADALPGLVLDKYGDVFTLQALTQAMDRDDLRASLLAALSAEFGPGISVFERVDARIRQLEDLPPRLPQLLHGEKTTTRFAMNGLEFSFDAQGGQKTGAFLDQRENYLAAEACARGQALDVFCYHGGFALHLARACDHVTGVDSSRPALEVAEQNAAANGKSFRSPEIEWLEADAFELLKDYSTQGRLFDTIVLDPPAFAKSKRMLDRAIAGYKEINLRALKMLRPGGVLITNSCSHHVSEADFSAMLASAAADAKRFVRILERRTQAKDHPIIATIPETAYLKCFVCTVA